MEYVFYVLNHTDCSKDVLYSDASGDSFDCFLAKIPSIVSRYLNSRECDRDFEFRFKFYK